MKALAAVLTTLILVACGGGGGGGGTPAVATGQFTDSPVKGLQYRTASQSGETGANGEFRYLPGETVTFFVGDITLGAAVGAAKVTPFDIAGISPPTTIPSSGQTTAAFDQAINLAIFLQTLDVDGNPANGIEIPASIRSITSGVALDFKQRRESFAINLTLRKLVVDGRSAGLWGGVKAIRTPTLAIKSMYATLGITPILDLLTTVETIDPNSSRLISRQTSTYDADGRQTGVRSEYDNNGVWERSTDSYFFDANGNLSHYETDSNDDGRVDRWADITFNIKGEVPLMVFVDDTNFDGMVDSRTTLNFTYNASGKMTEMRQEDDTNNDGTIDSLSIQTSSYDNNGRNVLDVSTSNGVVTLTTQSTYDSNGKIQTIRTEQDVDRNGIMDDLTIDTYDASGQLATSEEFSDYNGVVHTRTTYAYDSSGQMIMSETDADGDGRVDSRIRSVYNAMGKRVLRERDNDADGVADFRTVFTYDGDGYMILTEDDVGADGIVDQRTTFVHVKVAG